MAQVTIGNLKKNNFNLITVISVNFIHQKYNEA